MTRGEWAAALGIFTLALTIRLLGIRFGLPWFHHWDEGWITDSAAHMLQTPTWEPRVYQYGAPLPWLMALVIRGLSYAFPTRLFDPNDSELMHLIGRVITALIASSGAVATYIAARYATTGDRGARLRAILAAITYATAAELVTHGRYAVTDADLAALVAWTLAFGALYVRGGRVRWAAAMLVAGATAVAFKVTAGPIMLVPAALLLARLPALSRRGRWITLGLALPFATFVFFALNPNMVLHWDKAIADVTTRINQYERGGVPEFSVRARGPEHVAAILHALVFQVFHRWPIASAAVGLPAFAGLVRAVRARSLAAIAGMLHATVVVLGLGIASKAFLFRNYLVVVPLLCVGFGFAMEWLQQRARAPSRVAMVAFAALLIVVPCIQAIRTEQLTPDARLRAIDWIASQTSKPATISYTPQVGVDATADRRELRDVLVRPTLVALQDVDSEADVARVHPDFVMIVSHPDFPGRGDLWPFKSAAGYREVARFDANPYEHSYAVTPVWMGRFNVIVLERITS